MRKASYSWLFAFRKGFNVNTILDVDQNLLTQVCVYPGLERGLPVSIPAFLFAKTTVMYV